MIPCRPDQPWMPYHICMGQKITFFSVSDGEDIIYELKAAGCKDMDLRIKLQVAARQATRAINKMLASGAT